MNCEHFEHMLVDRAEGRLDASTAIELDAHLASCEACRGAAADFGDIAERLAAAGAAFGAVALHVPTDTTTIEVDAPALVHTGERGGGGRRVSRRHRVLRWIAPLAGAAGIGAALLFPLGVFDRKAGSAEAAMTLTAMTQALEVSRAVSCTIELVPEVGDVLSGRLLVVQAVIRLEMPDGRVVISDTGTGRTQVRLPTELKFIEAPARESDPVDLYDKLVRLSEHPSEDLGIEVIDGIPARVFIVRGVNGPLDADEYKVWINPHTSLPMKVEMPGRMGEVEQRGLAMGRLVLRGFQFNADVDISGIEFTPPPGYVEVALTADPLLTRVHTQVAARDIMLGVVTRHAETGEWPASLQTLVDAGHLTAERIRNPRVGQAEVENFGWIYFPPSGEGPDPQRVVVTERPTDPWTEVVVAYGDGHVEIVGDQAQYNQLLEASGGVAMATQPGGEKKPSLDRSSTVTVDPAKTPDKPGAVLIGGRIPLVVLNKDDLMGLSVEGAGVVEGDAKFHAARVRENPRLPRELQVNKFITSDDTVIATMAIGPDNPTHGLLSDAAAAMDRTQPPVLIDKIGQRYPALGFVHSTGEVGGVVRIRYFPGKPIKSINELPSVSASKPDEKLHLVFQVSAGAELTGFAIGEKLIAEFKPAVGTKTK